jgi:hypothetical protein
MGHFDRLSVASGAEISPCVARGPWVKTTMSEALKPAGQLTDRFGGKKLLLIYARCLRKPGCLKGVSLSCHLGL